MAERTFVDFHRHLDLYPDHQAAIAECDRAKVFTLAVTTTPRAWPRNEELTSSTKYVRAALGLHPQLVGERADELSIWKEYLPRTRYVGEVGLDAGPRFYRSFDLQRRVFEDILRTCAQSGGKILTVHSVRAVPAVLDMIETHLPRSRGSVVLHWFTGTKAQARRAADLGCYFSVNPSMLDNERHQALLTDLPVSRLLTETDGPFVQIEGRAIRASDVEAIVARLAQVRVVDAADLASIIRNNLKRLLTE